MKKPVIDLHCDLLYYLLNPNSNLHDRDLGCAIPYLLEGNVKLQIMAIFALTTKGSHHLGIKQAELFYGLNINNSQLNSIKNRIIPEVDEIERIGMLASIENASAFCDEDLSLKEGLQNLEEIKGLVGNITYIGLTHHAENRFGGGNYTSIGLKEDGKTLIDYLDNKKIAIDLSHTSDALAYDIINYISKQNFDIPIIASHSNYRHVFDHPRNLPDELAQEIIDQKGLIGLNFLRAFVNNSNPNALFDHLEHAINIGAQDNICFGADYFYHKDHPDKSRIPFFYKEHENASCYPHVLEVIDSKFGSQITDKIANKNVIRFLHNLWE
ncbi:membrane dipeptidase [Marivirga salinae]|uniref:Membrane dipeptidase n=1 Tax=Marivirga salinarum TaxID=3059078 RepID=A0AA51RBD4_9BACT|nr:membrane dipeptidase [Marivirga sp. BDSF4-3]WMN12091.1 membrane dipeptidase [Marivirga sp. BDSF4-3]